MNQHALILQLISILAQSIQIVFIVCLKMIGSHIALAIIIPQYSAVIPPGSKSGTIRPDHLLQIMPLILCDVISPCHKDSKIRIRKMNIKTMITGIKG